MSHMLGRTQQLQTELPSAVVSQSVVELLGSACHELHRLQPG